MVEVDLHLRRAALMRQSIHINRLRLTPVIEVFEDGNRLDYNPGVNAHVIQFGVSLMR
jgi:hypothetical protein